MTTHTPSPKSPLWGLPTKLVVGLSLVALSAALIARFDHFIPPLLITAMLIYLLHPMISFVVNKTRMSWGLAVNLIFLLFLLLVIGFFTYTGVAAVNQLQDLIDLVDSFITDLPNWLEEVDAWFQDISTNPQTIQIFSFTFELQLNQILSQLDVDLLAAGEQVLAVLQSVLGEAGGLVGSLAASALSGLGWGAFVFIISYFVLVDMGPNPEMFADIHLPGHMDDFRRLGRRTSRIWNAFLRGQLLLFALIIITSFVIMSALGVSNALGLAFLAGVAKFVPYVGPLVAGVVTAVVAYFQPGGNYLGLEPFAYALLVVGVAVLIDQVFDNVITPRIFGQTLGVHPAAVLIAALMAANLIGFLGLLLAAPVLATLQLYLGYTLRKLLDLDPWPDPETSIPSSSAWQRWLRRMGNNLRKTFRKRRKTTDERQETGSEDQDPGGDG